MSVVVRVMGPLEVISQGRPVLISAGKERGLLVLLALQSGRVVPSERLIEALLTLSLANASIWHRCDSHQRSR